MMAARLVRALLFLSGFCLISITLSCRKDNTVDLRGLDVPLTPILTEDRQWGVVTESYLTVKQEPGSGSSTVITLRRGEVVEVTEILVFGDSYWCRIVYQDSSGWAPRNSFDLYDRPSQARQASRRLVPEE
jgi:hypothetical protein